MSLSRVLGADSSTILEMGRQAIATEAEALRLLASLDAEFVAAVELVQNTKGRLLVCGVGRSASIGTKLVATFVATGTPACSLNAAEALHGGVGLMMAGDTLLLLSKSGEARECGLIIRWAKALSIPVIAITSNRASLVAREVDVVLLLPAQPEVCPFGSTLTTSMTMMGALVDALAMALVRIRGMTAGDLYRRGPGGGCGLDLLLVDDFMHRDDALPLLPSGASMEAALDVIGSKGFGVMGIVSDDGCLLGVVTDGDIRRNAGQLSRVTPEAIMTSRPRTLRCGANAREALATMSQSQITSLFVLGDNIARQVRGLVHIHDLLRLGIG
ncbi:arabinose-5-phosphate isomerase [Hephaestia caeni]|uniref:Arabinose-5-phosphate isomerase n=1 Tax=Hephaestia caeni TaxID=645617 RepID=A0A397PEK8_9SPHN|nr:SIS domain-containing protein [Hephaestia caeni]RIA46349.1 arabinose-5-phosphate isomerase [Hephaestia caeni]